MERAAKGEWSSGRGRAHAEKRDQWGYTAEERRRISAQIDVKLIRDGGGEPPEEMLAIAEGRA